MNKINRIIYCIIDDVRSSHFFNYIEEGLLPNFKKLMDNGIYSKTCITDFPSVTYPTQPTLITGTYTGDYRKEPCHGIPVYNWMGRNMAPPILRSYGSAGSEEFIQVYMLNHDLEDNCQTILEMIDEGNKSSITQFISRGTNYLYPETKLKLVFYYEILLHSKNHEKMAARMNTTVVRKLLDNFERPKKYFRNKEVPIASHLWFATPDAILHEFGYDSALYKKNLINIDKCMSILLSGLENLGYMEDTAIAVTADHGNFKGQKVGNINPFLNKYGLSAYHKRKNPKGNINIAEFGSMGFFYFKGREKCRDKRGWTIPTLNDLENYGPKKVNLLKALFDVDGTKLIYYRADENTHLEGKIHLKRKIPDTGKIIEGIIEYKGTGKDYKTKYFIENGDTDVFGYQSDVEASKLIDGKFHSIDEWTAGTHHLDFPLYPDLIPRHFKNPRSADVILSTCGTVCYNIKHGKKENDHLYSHDIGLRNSAIVPLIIAGCPEIPQKEIPYCKTTDIVPTLLKMLGKKPHESVVGNSLI